MDLSNYPTLRAAEAHIRQPIECAGESALNTSGFEPLDLRVLILPDPAEKVTAGGIIIPEVHAERKQMAMTFGTLVAVGENAWEEAVSRSPAFRRPMPGDRIVFAKYGGIEIKGRDGREYRLMNDEDVIGRVTEES
jgi:chaperonin GroES